MIGVNVSIPRRPQVGDREGAALDVLGPEPPLLRPRNQLARDGRDLPDAECGRALDHGHDQAGLGINGDSDMGFIMRTI